MLIASKAVRMRRLLFVEASRLSGPQIISRALTAKQVLCSGSSQPRGFRYSTIMELCPNNHTVEARKLEYDHPQPQNLDKKEHPT